MKVAEAFIKDQNLTTPENHHNGTPGASEYWGKLTNNEIEQGILTIFGNQVTQEMGVVETVNTLIQKIEMKDGSFDQQLIMVSKLRKEVSKNNFDRAELIGNS